MVRFLYKIQKLLCPIVCISDLVIKIKYDQAILHTFDGFIFGQLN